MNNLLTLDVGIDSAIQDIQTDLYDYLTTLWSGEMNAYGRVYKNPANVGDQVPDYYRTSKIVVPEWYNSLKKDYEEVYFDDNFASVICFLVGDTDVTNDANVFVSDVKCVFMLDLSKVYPNVTERRDAKAQKDVVDFMSVNADGRYTIEKIQRGIDTIFYEYKTRAIRVNDMQPFHVFSVNIKLYYYLNCN